LAAWSEERGVRLECIQPGKPVQNAYVESFNGLLREECLNANWVYQSQRRAAQNRNLAARLQLGFVLPHTTRRQNIPPA